MPEAVTTKADNTCQMVSTVTMSEAETTKTDNPAEIVPAITIPKAETTSTADTTTDNTTEIAFKVSLMPETSSEC